MSQDFSVTFAGNKFFRDILGFDSVRAVQYNLTMVRPNDGRAVGVILREDGIDRMYIMCNMLVILRSKTSPSQTTQGA